MPVFSLPNTDLSLCCTDYTIPVFNYPQKRRPTVAERLYHSDSHRNLHPGFKLECELGGRKYHDPFHGLAEKPGVKLLQPFTVLHQFAEHAGKVPDQDILVIRFSFQQGAVPVLVAYHQVPCLDECFLWLVERDPRIGA